MLGAFLLPAGLAAMAASTTAWALATTLATSAFLSGVSAQLQSGKRPRPSSTVEYAGTVEPRRIIYGEVLVSGMHVIPPVTSGGNNKMLHTVLAIAGHEVNAITTVRFGQEAVGTIGSITGASTDGLVSTGTYDDKAWIRRYLGTSSQTADYILDNALSIWTSNHRGRGITYIAIQRETDEEVYKTGADEVTCLVQGMKCYDPRLDTSPGANPTNASYIAYTNNPALILANYLCGTSLGLEDGAANIDWDMVSDAADICDELVDVPTAATQKRYTFNGTFYCVEPFEDVIQAIAGAMMGSCLFSGDKWRMRAGAWETAAFEITDSNVMGPVILETAYPYKERYNGIRGSFIDPDNNYQPNEFPAVQSASYVAADGESVFRDVQFQACTNVYEAQRDAIYLVRKSRNKQSATIPCDMSLWKVRPGMTGIVTIAELGWVSKTVRCEAWGFTPDGLVALTVREELASDWDDPLEADYTTPLAISNPTPVYFTPEAPSALAAVGTPRAVNLSWTAPALMPTGAVYQVYEYTSSTPFASASLVWEGVATSCRLDKSDTTTRYYWVRVRMPDGTTGTEYPTSTSGIAGEAKATVRAYTQTGAGTTQVTLSAPATNATEQVAYATVDFNAAEPITVNASFGLSVASAGTYSVRIAVMYATTSGTTQTFVGAYQVKTTAAAERFTVVGLLPAGSFAAGDYTRRFGFGIDVFGDGANNVVVDILDSTVVVEVLAL